MFINRDLSYPYLPSSSNSSKRFFLKSLSINVLFGNIDRKIGQVFPWGINTLTFPLKEWGAEPTPHSRGNLFIYSYLFYSKERRSGMLLYSKEHRTAVLVHKNELHLNLFTRKSAALPCSWKWIILISVTQKSAALPYLKNGVLFYMLYWKERRTLVR